MTERDAYIQLASRVALSYLSTSAPWGSTVRFGRVPGQKTIVFTPRRSEDRKRTPVLFVHGGSWSSGSASTYRFVGRWFARQRPAAVLGYRLAGVATYPAQLSDVQAGVTSAVESWRAKGNAPLGIVLAGHSAGAHLAALAALDRGWKPPVPVVGLLALSGPLDLATVCKEPSWCPSVRALMGGDEGWDIADPLLCLTGDERFSALAIHGELDRVVSPLASARFVARMCDLGGDAHLDLVDNGYHATVMNIFVDRLSQGDDVRGFLDRIDGRQMRRGSET
ncbi:MAG TPA: alpha/beta hydrolase fold domain-containing protein [Coriobacteriia bacterium]|nr:alpha/beta hydrolase fold domain-containing protein [Coriobacteriia bacterium]